MNSLKSKRLIIAVTVGMVVLAVVLLCVMSYQLIAISVKSNKIEKLKQRLAELDVLIESLDDNLAAIKEREWIIYEAWKLGYYFVDDNPL